MGAREDLLTAARSLEEGGMPLFSPAELIARARFQGSTYPDSTLRTYIVAVMCRNSPDNHATKYRDFERVAHGMYRLAEDESDSHDLPLVPDLEAESAADVESVTHDDEWFWEGNIQAAVVSHLASEGWLIRSVADTATRQHGIDIVAHHAGVTLLVEVKGYPGSTYASGTRKGEAKTTQPAAQARTYFGNALLSGLLMRAESPDARVVLAFPDMATFASLAQRVARPLADASVELWLVSEDGTVTTSTP